MKNLSTRKGHWTGIIVVGVVVVAGCSPIRPSAKRQSLRSTNTVQGTVNEPDTSIDNPGEGGPAQTFAATAQSPAPSPTPTPSPVVSKDALVQIRWGAKSVASVDQAAENETAVQPNGETTDISMTEIKLTAAELATLKSSGQIQLATEYDIENTLSTGANSGGSKLVEIVVRLNRTAAQIAVIDPVVNQWILANRRLEMAPTSDSANMFTLLNELDSVSLFFRRQEVLVGGNESLDGSVH